MAPNKSTAPAYQGSLMCDCRVYQLPGIWYEVPASELLLYISLFLVGISFSSFSFFLLLAFLTFTVSELLPCVYCAYRIPYDNDVALHCYVACEKIA